MSFFNYKYPAGVDADTPCQCFIGFENWPQPNQKTNGTYTYSADSPVDEVDIAFPGEEDHPRNGFDWRPYTAWRTGGGEWWEIEFSGPVPVDYFAMAFYGAVPNFFLEYWDGAAWERVVDMDTTEINTYLSFDVFEQPAFQIRKPIMLRFEEVTAAKWRFGIEEAFGEVRIGCMAFGRAVGIPTQEIGFTPPRLSRSNAMTTTVSESGMFLGRSVTRLAAQFDISANGLPLLFLQDAWLAFLRHAERQPFFFQWSDMHPNNPVTETVFCWCEEPPGHSAFATNQHLDTTVSVKGVID